MSDWLDGIIELTGRGEAAALVTVADTRGSTPREAGTKMAVGADVTWDTIGGGQLEHAAIESARLLLEQGEDGDASTLERHTLNPALGQCCGGVAWLLVERIPVRGQGWVNELVKAREAGATTYLVTRIGRSGKRVVSGDDASIASLPADAAALARQCMSGGKPVCRRGEQWLVEPVPPPDFHIALFGAGHVGKALAGILATLPCRLTWVDSRRERLPEAFAPNVRTVRRRDPESLVAGFPPGSFFLVMTHSHALDLAICERVLARGDFAYCGVIGSASKRRNFEKRLRLKGVTESLLNRLTCPIGAAGISGKRPAVIAVAAAAELLQAREAAPGTRSGGVSSTG